MKRSATAVWNGNGKDGKGHLTTQSSTLNNTQYSFTSRFESGIGTNPEELIAAAHAGCFSMKLSFVLNEAGFQPESLNTKCEVKFENGAVVSSHLTLHANIPGIDAEQFAPLAEEAKINCPISKLLNTEISLDYTLN